IHDASERGLAGYHGIHPAPTQDIRMLGKGHLDTGDLAVVHPVFLQPRAQRDTQEGAQARHTDLLAHAVLSALNAAALARHPARLPPPAGRPRAWARPVAASRPAAPRGWWNSGE